MTSTTNKLNYCNSMMDRRGNNNVHEHFDSNIFACVKNDFKLK